MPDKHLPVKVSDRNKRERCEMRSNLIKKESFYY